MQAVIHLMPSALRRSLFMVRAEHAAQINTLFDDGIYEKKDPIEVAPWVTSHQEAAEAMFELTNDPNLQTEREQLYGNGRSLSSGDIVEVIPTNGVGHSFWLCMSTGWKELL